MEKELLSLGHSPFSRLGGLLGCIGVSHKVYHSLGIVRYVWLWIGVENKGGRIRPIRLVHQNHHCQSS